MPIKFYATFTESGSDWGGRTKEQVKAIIEGGLRMWMKATCHSVVLKYAGTTKSLAGEKDNRNVITWVGGIPGTP